MISGPNSLSEVKVQFPGIERCDPTALGRFAFFVAAHEPGEDLMYRGTGEDYAEWHEGVYAVIRQVHEWHEDTDGQSRFGLADSIRRKRQKEVDLDRFIEALSTVSSDEAYELVRGEIRSGKYRVETIFKSSPMFHDGRVSVQDGANIIDDETGIIRVPHSAKVFDQDGDELDERITDFINSGYALRKAKEVISSALDEIEPVDDERLRELRHIFGAKGALLTVFAEKIGLLNSKLSGYYRAMQLGIPRFSTVGIDLYQKWLANAVDFADDLEKARQEAVGLVTPNGKDGGGSDLLIVRSSAVYSEDGDEHTGAGVYDSIVVDPRDPVQFSEAIEAVYRSTNSSKALSYQRQIGVSDERMGLVLQRYCETSSDSYQTKSFWGYANSAGQHPSILELHTNEGSLLFDRKRVTNQLLVTAESYEYAEGLLHSQPDRRTDIASAAYVSSNVAHAAMLAEKLFGRPIQLEFVQDRIVQVRPLVNYRANETIEFPKGLKVIETCASTGVGDMTLGFLDAGDDNSEKEGFVVFWNEGGFTIGTHHAGYDALPKSGAVIIVRPSRSGHIQAICRERGLLCIYPKPGEKLGELEKYADILTRRDRAEGRKHTKVRVVSDGYEGRVYLSN